MNHYRLLLSMCVMALCPTLSVQAQLAWKIFGNLKEGRADCQVVCIGNGQALVISGYNTGGSPLTTCEFLDITTKTITDAAPMNYARAGELSSGLYYVRLIAGGWMQTERVMLEK